MASTYVRYKCMPLDRAVPCALCPTVTTGGAALWAVTRAGSVVTVDVESGRTQYTTLLHAGLC